ncbi:MAG: hypothetical protein IKA75_03410 [Bacteroidaceae bacterium]|nr:hypothetical protein [Bacteroidaceae bacterium]
MKGMIVKSKVAEEYEMLEVAIPNGVVDVHVEMNRYNGPNWGVGGLKIPEEEHVSWRGGHLQFGDEIQIEFTDIEQPAPHVYQESHSDLKKRMVMISNDNDKDEEIWQRKLERYYRLKVILESEGLIETE